MHCPGRSGKAVIQKSGVSYRTDRTLFFNKQMESAGLYCGIFQTVLKGYPNKTNLLAHFPRKAGSSESPTPGSISTSPCCLPLPSSAPQISQFLFGFSLCQSVTISAGFWKVHNWFTVLGESVEDDGSSRGPGRQAGHGEEGQEEENGCLLFPGGVPCLDTAHA